MTPGAILWDFDGTLAFREGMWSGTILGILKTEEPDLKISRDDIRPFIRDGFPWHRPDVPHPETADPDAWWENLASLFESVFLAFGVDPDRVSVLATRVRSEYCNPCMWSLYEDTLPTLEHLSGLGWKHLVLSNHVPELPEIAGSLGLSEHLKEIFSSATTGYEKPNREAYLGALRTLSRSIPVLMVGDGIDADAGGAEAIGLPSILVRRPGAQHTFQAEALEGVLTLLETVPERTAGQILDSQEAIRQKQERS